MQRKHHNYAQEGFGEAETAKYVHFFAGGPRFRIRHTRSAVPQDVDSRGEFTISIDISLTKVSTSDITLDLGLGRPLLKSDDKSAVKTLESLVDEIQRCKNTPVLATW